MTASHDVAAAYRAAGYWTGAPLGELVRAQAERHPGHCALVAGGTRLSYAELDAEIDTVAAGFADLGVRPGDRLVLQLPNVAELVVTLFALLRLGAPPVLALPSHRAAEITYLAEQSGAVGYVLPERHLGFDHRTIADELRRTVPGIAHLLVAGDPGAEFTALSTVRAAPRALPAPDGADPAFLLLSGGTTGMPKLIPRTHDDYTHNVAASAAAAGFDEATVYLAVLPVTHNFSLGCPGVLGALTVGGTAVLAPTPEPGAAFALIEAERVTYTAVVPSALHLWMAEAGYGAADLSSLRWVQVGAAKLTPELAARIPAELGAGVQQSFGMSEGLLVQTRPGDPFDVVAHTQGTPVSSGDEIRIVDDEDRDVPDGVVGHLLARGPYTIRSYLDRPGAPGSGRGEDAFTADGFYRTGDLVRRTSAGQLVVTGRAKDVVNRGGEMIAAAEVEAHLAAHPAVVAAAVVGFPDPALGERSCAVVVAPSGAPTPAEFREFLRRRGLAAFKWPDRVEVVDDLPRTALGKVDKKQVRARLLTGMATLINDAEV